MASVATHFGFLAAATILANGCASGGGRSDDAPLTPNLLTREQIAPTHVTNAYDAIVQLRSRWLLSKGQTALLGSGGAGGMPVRAYLDDRRLNAVEEFRYIDIASVEYIEYFSPTDASARWGFDHGGGAIMVSTRPRGR